MKKIKIVLLLFVLGVIGVYALNMKAIKKNKGTKIHAGFSPDSLKEGDLIFQTNIGGQGLAIQLVTHSPYTHIGVIFKQDEEWMVYEAVEPVQVVSLETFTDRGDEGKYVIRRLKGSDTLLTAVKLDMMKKYLDKQMDKHYDIHFGWADDKFYCSELVWKCYNAVGISIGPLKKLKEFDLSSPVVKKIMAERYGKDIPYNEKVISPGDIFNNKELKEVYRN